MTGPVRKIRVLVVDDSALMRSVLSRGLSTAPDIEIVGTARDPYDARDQLVKLRPDVITLDVEMPKMDGVTFLRKFMAVLPTPTIVLSSLTQAGSKLAVQALEAGAVDVLAKPTAGVAAGVDALMGQIIERVRVAARTRVTQRLAPVEHVAADAPLEQSTDLVIGLGASTGGVAALTRILPAFPPWSPGIVIVQHMPAGFTADFADRLNSQCAVKVAEARDGDRVLRGHVLVAPGGDKHLEVRRFGGEYRIALVPGDPTTGHVPAVDVFFASLARHVGKNASVCLMTGMGADGAEGMRQLRAAGGRTFAQDRETSAVWGMPSAAHALGASERLVPLGEIPAAVLGIARAPGPHGPSPG